MQISVFVVKCTAQSDKLNVFSGSCRRLQRSVSVTYKHLQDA